MLKKIFRLWDRHTTWFVRILFVLSIPAAIWQTFGVIYCYFLLILWLIVHTGYEKKWGETE